MKKNKDIIYYERVVDMQKEKIAYQNKELDKMKGIYNREIRTTTILSSLNFLMKVIINKLIKLI